MNDIYYHSIIKLQKVIRGFLTRIKYLPIILYRVQNYLSQSSFQFSSINDDGRVNSSYDEDNIIDLLIYKFKHKIKKPNIRNWYDIAVYDNYYGWLPVNIKTTTTTTNDNSGNLSICVQAYTNYECDLDKKYENGLMSKILIDKLKKNEFNLKHKKDYYFLVLNKRNSKEVIVNSVKGLNQLTPNVNNLPFQIKWNKNKTFQYKHIYQNIELFINIIQKPNPSWKEDFLNQVRLL